MRHIILTILFIIPVITWGQEKSRLTRSADVTIGGGTYRGSLSLAHYYTWKIGKKERIGVGLGVRYSGFLGANLYYITAPAELTSESTSPLILFRENVIENIDSVLIKSPQVNSFNLAVNIDYLLTPKITVGFNIDAIGFSFGSKEAANYINGIQGKNTSAKPTSFNILLISDNDRGTLNSEFYGKYTLNKKFSVKLAAQFLFTEYTTETKVQQFPKPNDRFRNKALLAAAGIVYNF